MTSTCPVTGRQLPERGKRRGAHQLYASRAAAELASAWARYLRAVAAVLPECDAAHRSRIRCDLMALVSDLGRQGSGYSDRTGSVLAKVRLPLDLLARVDRLPGATRSERLRRAVLAGLDTLDGGSAPE